MPDGLVYEGVSEEPMAYSGGSAAQSTVLHAFDELLGIRHSEESSKSHIFPFPQASNLAHPFTWLHISPDHNRMYLSQISKTTLIAKKTPKPSSNLKAESKGLNCLLGLTPALMEH